MSVLFNCLKGYFDSQEWKYEYNEDEGYLSMRMNLKTVDSCSVYAQMRDDEGFTIYTVFPIKAPEAKRMAISEFITRANYGLINGNFEEDFSDGEIRFKVTTLCGDIELEHEIMARIVNMGFAMLDRYGQALLSVIYGGANVKDAVDAAEGLGDDDDDDDE